MSFGDILSIHDRCDTSQVTHLVKILSRLNSYQEILNFLVNFYRKISVETVFRFCKESLQDTF